jgi:hypothetical protein
MQNSYVACKNFPSEMETFCVLLIEKELEMFFSTYMESACSYSLIIAKNLSLHNKKAFEELVLSSQSIKAVIQTIIEKVNVKIKKNLKYLYLDHESIDFLNHDNYYDFLNDTIENFRITQVTTKLCECIIDSTIPYILDDVCPNILIKRLFKKVISSKKILDKNNLENQIDKHKELIYKQIEGFLINLKIKLRNELIKACLICINSMKNIYDSAFIA